MDVSDVLRIIDEDSDDDFGGYVDEEDLEGFGEDESESSQVLDTAPSNSGLPEYLQQSGYTVDMSDKDPVDFFHLFVTDQMLESIVQ